jgi:hypothetical protein
MIHGPIGLYVVGVGAAIGAIYAADTAPLSPAVVVGLAVLAPLLPVALGYWLTHRKLVKQDEKVQEIHVLVNSRLSSTLDALQNALLETIRLKGKVGEPLTPVEREVAAAPAGLPMPPDVASALALADDLPKESL